MSRARDLADSADLAFDGNTLKIDSTNNRVGIGTDTPQSELVVRGSTPQVTLEPTADTQNTRIQFCTTDGTIQSNIQGGGNLGSAIKFVQSSSETMRIDSSGNLLVGKTSLGLSNTGVEARATGQISATRDSAPVAFINRKTNDGNIVEFQKDGTTVGSIASANGDLIIGTGDTGLFFNDSTNQIHPYNITGLSGGSVDGAIDLGQSGVRWKNLYLSGGVVFGSTGGSVTSKTLDDYEEGTWTPTIVGTSGGTATIGSFYQAIYTKVGRVVHAFFYVGNVDTTSGGFSGSMRIGGLPFTASSGTSYNYGQNVSVGYCNLFTFDEADISMYGYVEGTNVALSKGSSMTTVQSTELNSTSSGRMMFGITYNTPS